MTFYPMKLQDQIIEALSVLIGLPLWEAVRAMNMEMFSFGERRKRLNRKGEEIEIGEYALHVQCPWRIIGLNRIVVGYEDRNYPEDEDSDWQAFNPDGPTRCEARVAAWLREYSGSPLIVERVEADAVGGFKLFLHHGFILEAFPADSLQGEYSEHWRLLQPSEKKKHFVITGYGVEH
jgi:hypothetical protein